MDIYIYVWVCTTQCVKLPFDHAKKCCEHTRTVVSLISNGCVQFTATPYYLSGHNGKNNNPLENLLLLPASTTEHSIASKTLSFPTISITSIQESSSPPNFNINQYQPYTHAKIITPIHLRYLSPTKQWVCHYNSSRPSISYRSINTDAPSKPIRRNSRIYYA